MTTTTKQLHAKLIAASEALAGNAIVECIESECAERSEWAMKSYGSPDSIVDWLYTGIEAWGDVDVESFLKLAGITHITNRMLDVARHAFVEEFVRHGNWNSYGYES